MEREPDTNSSPVHIDFSLERRDLFRASLHMAKRRLLIGVGILSVYMLGVFYLFALIGELGMLLKISPLFIGLPMMGFAGQLLRLHATCRKYYSGLSESQRRITYTFTDDADGYDLKHGDSFSHIAWTDISKVVERSVFFLIYSNRYDAHLIPKRGFLQESDLSRFKSIVRSKLGNKAILT